MLGNPGIILTGYVSENEKTDLYLNALALLSPSLVEGFGIPVLDSACLGMTALASDSNSHIELQSMEDFNEWITIAKTLESRDWSLAMRAIAFRGRELQANCSSERKKRLTRYHKLNQKISNQFSKGISDIIKSKKVN